VRPHLGSVLTPVLRDLEAGSDVDSAELRRPCPFQNAFQ
jgi:hypothetical protein